MILQLRGFYFPHCNVAVVTQARNNTHITEWTDGMKPTASGSAYNVSVHTAMLSLEKHGRHVHKNTTFPDQLSECNPQKTQMISWWLLGRGTWASERMKTGWSCGHLTTSNQTEQHIQYAPAPPFLEAQNPWNLRPLLPFPSETLTDVSGLKRWRSLGYFQTNATQIFKNS